MSEAQGMVLIVGIICLVVGLLLTGYWWQNRE